MIILDTNVISEVMAVQPSRAVAAWMDATPCQGSVARYSFFSVYVCPFIGFVQEPVCRQLSRRA